MNLERRNAFRRNRLTQEGIELVARLSILVLLVYWSLVLISPVISIAIWSVVLCVALYPSYERFVSLLGGRRKLGAGIFTVVCLVLILGPATFLAMDLISSFQTLSASAADWSIPSPPPRIKQWPLVGDTLYQFWDLASTNLRAALAKVAPQFKVVGSALVSMAAGAGLGVLRFFGAVVIMGFLFPPAPYLISAARKLARRLAPVRGEYLLALAASTIRAVSRGVIGIAALQALLLGIGFSVAGTPGASLLASASLVLAIIQIGPALIVVPSIIWAWSTLDATSALLFTAYMVPVNLMDNVLRPFVMARGLKTPMLVILAGVIGGTVSRGITGLFLGPIVLAVIWELVAVWIDQADGGGFEAAAPSPGAETE